MSGSTTPAAGAPASATQYLRSSAKGLFGFLGFIVAPYLYFTGASAQSARFSVLGISGVGFASSATDLIYDGFNIVVANILPGLIWKILAACVLVALIGWASVVTAVSGEQWAKKTRKRLEDAKTWLRLQYDDVGIVYAPLVAILFGLLCSAIFLGWIGLMSIGHSWGTRSATDHLNAIKACVKSKGAAAGCTTITILGSNNAQERVVGSLVFMDKDRAALSDGRSVRLLESKNVLSVITVPKL